MIKKEISMKLPFQNEVINKKKLQSLMQLTFHNYGVIKSSLIADRIKNLTFHYATISGISLSVEDLRVPYVKRTLIGMTTNEVDLTEQNFKGGNITTVERYQKVIDIWNNANNSLKDEVLTYFRESDPLNPLYIMAFSGARGNISQVRQLVGMRGLMADPQGQIIDLPIKSNFREGLKVTEYIISSYGARKGLVDTALRTADSGYLTRRLVDVAQDIIVREEDCLTKDGLSLEDLFKRYKTNSSLQDRLIGRLLVKELKNIQTGEIWPIDTEIDNKIITKIIELGLEDIEVRSPLTCDAVRSVCRKCYGWHLSYSKIIDLGEAVGILAAQSIGEPGTQLTMRTFHTGGVFSGDLTKQIRAPFSGTVKYDLNTSTTIIRTIHGEKGFNLTKNLTVIIENTTQTKCCLALPSNALLLISNGQKVYRNQVVAEIKKDTNLILEEERKDIYTEVAGSVFLQNIQVEESIDGDGAMKKISKTTGLMWVLHGNRYVLPGSSTLRINSGQKFFPNETISSQKLLNKHTGIVNLASVSRTGEIKIINSSMILENAVVSAAATTTVVDHLELFTPMAKKHFQLSIKENELLKHGQTIATLLDDSYKTETGGIIYYSTSNLGNKKRRNTKKIFTGSLYWVPEETHNLTTTDIENLFSKDGDFVKKGTTLALNVVSTINGILHVNEFNSEIVIKPGELYQITGSLLPSVERTNRFAEPGEIIFVKPHTNIIIQKLSYLEFIDFHGIEYILVRPVMKYKVPEYKGFVMEHRFFPNENNRNVAFRTVKRIFYKDGERVKSNSGGVNLLQTFLVLDIKKNANNLQAQIEYLPHNTLTNGTQYKLKVTLYEVISTNETLIKDSTTTNKMFFKHLVCNNQYVAKNTTIAKVDMVTKVEGILVAVNKTKTSFDILILTDNDIKKCYYQKDSENLLVKKGDLVRIGTYLTNQTRAKYAGQIYNIDANTIDIRVGRPYLVSEGTVLQADANSLVDKSDLLATLVYEKLKTVDIVQGLPKVEEILEARKIKNGCILAPHEGKAYLNETKIEITIPNGDTLTVDIQPNTKVNFTNGKSIKFLEPLTDGPISPHEKLETLFNYYQLKYPVHIACKMSFKYLQLFLVNEVQRTYFSQGVQIADKHIEIIVKQMTSKVRVSYSGDTTLLPGEILDINQAEIITKTTLSVNEEPPVYRPMLLGLTKASLNSDSFISAASFQETTRVLTEAAIEGKKDWLNGLKENVIIGRLIPAGTGFNCFENLKKVSKEASLSLLIRPSRDNKLKSFVLKSRVS